MSLTNGHNVSKETWDSHNKMMLEPLFNNDSEVCVHWMFERDGLNTHGLETAVMIQSTNSPLKSYFWFVFFALGWCRCLV